MQNAKLLNYLHLHFIVFIWGFTAVLGALISIDAIPLVWYRMGIAVILVAIFLGIKQQSFKIGWKFLWQFAFAGILIAAHWITFFMAIKASNVSITLAVLSTGAFFTSLLEPLFYKRRIIGYEVLFGLLILIGLYLIFKINAAYWEGILWALISAFLSASFSVLNGKLAPQFPASLIAVYELFFGFLAISIYLLLTSGFSHSFFALQASDWFYLALLASACTAYAFIASVHVMRWLTPYTVMLTINLEPVYGILLAIWLLGQEETMRPQFYFGAAIILATILCNGIVKLAINRKIKLPYKQD